ncbi:MAG TPA: hypothetical protein VFG21_00095 [Xanthomonadaceae bacterium]|nr:hypothetical protein [Xanthomonadaceae bacterium]
MILMATAAVLLAGCNTIRPTVPENPPPRVPLSEFSHYRLEPVVRAPGKKPESKHDAGAREKLQGDIDEKLAPLLAEWNAAAGGEGRTLVITPVIEELRFVGVTGRVALGTFGGSSAIRMTVRMTAEPGGELIAAPEIYQRANAYGAGYSFGATDYAMLLRTASVLEQYLRRNHAQAVGGPTGLEEAPED